MSRRLLASSATALLALVLLGGAVTASEEPQAKPADLINALLSGLLGFREVTPPQLQQEVAEIGGIAFKAPVPLDYLPPSALPAYLKNVMDEEYPPAMAEADERALIALDLLPAGTRLRELRAKLLEENVAGFYDERPGKKKLYAVSDDQALTPSNQIVLAHELRHALQDQYIGVHETMPAGLSDFDDRRMAFLALLEGDATLVMERYLMKRLGAGADSAPQALSSLALGPSALPGAPDVLRDHLVVPYLAGRDFALAVWQRGGWDAVRRAWEDPPRSTEQVLHAEKYFQREAPRVVEVTARVAGGRMVREAVLGEVLIRTLLGPQSEVAAAGWGGDLYRVWDVSGRTLLVWRTEWDRPQDAREFEAAAVRRFTASHGRERSLRGARIFGRGAWTVGLRAVGSDAVVLVSSNDAASFDAALKELR